MMTPPPPPGAAPGKKGLPPLAWAGIGCGGLILLTVLAGGLLVGTCAKKGIQFASELAANPDKAAAEMMATTNPAIEKVSEDETAGTMTIRLKDSGETVTLSYQDLALGRIPVSGVTPPPDPGDLAKIPAWVPRYPGAVDEASLFHVDEPLRVQGMIIARTSDDHERVADFFEREAGKLSLDSSSSSSMNLNGTRSLSLKFKGGKRELTVMAFGKSGDPLVIQTSYRESP